MRTALRHRGRLLVDVVNRERIEAHFVSKDSYEHEGHLVLKERGWDGKRRRQVTKRIMVKPDGTRRAPEYDL